MKILLVTTGQPSLNPRLVKEADTLAANGFNVTVLYAYWNEWGTDLDKALLSARSWKAICVGGNPHTQPFTYFISRLIYRFSRFAEKNTRIGYFNKFALARSTFFLMRSAKKHIADLYIGHNLGALPAVVKAAKKHRKKCGFDAEDFHRYEISDDNKDFDVKLKSSVENKYIPQLNYLTASSTQITDAYTELFPSLKPVTILNVFPADAKISLPALNASPVVKLFWVSQTIGIKRGLEDVIQALQLLQQCKFELNLLGHHTNETKAYIERTNHGVASIYYHKPVAPDALSGFASNFDIGLALEPGFSFNNNNALSNKIFTYMQAGLAIIASDTIAQQYFINKYPQIGKVYTKGDPAALADVLLNYFNNRQSLYASSTASWQLAHKELNWETEGKKFLGLITNTLTNIE